MTNWPVLGAEARYYLRIRELEELVESMKNTCEIHKAVDGIAYRTACAVCFAEAARTNGTFSDIETTAREIAKFHCTPGTMDGCQYNDGDTILCRTCSELASEIATALRAASLNSVVPEGRETAWQPIETAPQEFCRHLLVWTPDDECVHVAYLDDGMESGSWQDAFGDPDEVLKPTHWMPLPPAPETRQE